MGSPSTSLATLRPDLGGSFEEFDTAMDRKGFIANRVLPVFESPVQAGVFGKIPLEELLQTRNTARANRSGYSRGDWTFTSDSFVCEEHGAEEAVDNREAKMYANYFDAERISAERARDVVLRNAEIRAAALIFNATTWAGASLTTAVSTEWSTVASATPTVDVEAAARKVFANSGMWPNALIITKTVFRNLRNCTNIIDRLKYQGFVDVRAGHISEQQLAAVFDLEHIIVAGSSKNTANMGQTASLAEIWDDEYAMVCRLASSQDLSEPCLGRTIHWGEDGSTIGGTFESYRDETVRADVVRVRHDVDEKVLYTEMGHLLSNISA